jgi:hypothetical protein
VNCVSVSASVFAEATPRQVRLRSSSYDGTRQSNILNRPLRQTIPIWLTKAGFVVKINFFYAGIVISDQFESACGGYGPQLDSLTLYGGIHHKFFGYHRMLSKRFPYAIYYKLEEESVVVEWRVLDLCRDHKKIRQSLEPGRTSHRT